MNTLGVGLPVLATGFVLGAIGSMPVAGPVSALVLRRGLAARFGEARAVAAGAALAEGAHVFFALRGLSWLATRWPLALLISQGLGIALLLVAGVWLWTRPVAGAAESDPARRVVRGKRAHFGIGLAVAFGNLGILLNWTAVMGALRRWGCRPEGLTGDLLFALSVAAGIGVWFALVLDALRRHHARVPEAALRWMTRGVAVVMVLLALMGAIGLARSGGAG